MLQAANASLVRQAEAQFLPDFLTGELEIEGRFTVRLVGLTRRFWGTASGRWCDNALVLDESFVYENGRTEQRTWRLTFDDGGAFTSTCCDVAGAGRGCFNGQSYSHSYMFRLPMSRNGFYVRIEETYERLDDAHVHYAATVSRWWIPLGSIQMRLKRS